MADRNVEALARPAESIYRVVVGSTIWSLNGVNVFSMNLVRGLIRRGIEATILLTRHGDEDDKPLPAPSDVPFETLALDRDTSLPARWTAVKRYLESRAPCIYIPNHDFDHSCIAPELPADVAVVGVVHSDDPQHYQHVRCLGRYWNAAVAVSKAVAARTGHVDPALRARTTTIPYGIDVPADPATRAPRHGGPLRVAYVGRLDDYQKRVFDLPTIMERVHRAGAAVELTIVGGGGGVGDRLRKMFASAVERGSVRFAGILGQQEVHELLDRSDALLLPSAFEGLPLTLLEAMARGCVPVVSDIRSGVPELVRDGVNGYRVPIGNTRRFAERLATLARDAQLRSEMSAAAHATIARGPYGIDAMVDSYLALFDRVWHDVRSGAFVRPTGEVRPFRWRPPLWRSRVAPPLRVLAYYGRRILGGH